MPLTLQDALSLSSWALTLGVLAPHVPALLLPAHSSSTSTPIASSTLPSTKVTRMTRTTPPILVLAAATLSLAIASWLDRRHHHKSPPTSVEASISNKVLPSSPTSASAIAATSPTPHSENDVEAEEAEEDDDDDAIPRPYLATSLLFLLFTYFSSKAKANVKAFNAPKHLFALAVALGAAPSLARLVTGKDADVPACLAMALGLAMDHVEAASVILLMVTGGEALEDLAMHRAGTALRSLLA